MTFVSAYYGPNADLFGNIKNDYWHYSAVKDVDATILWILIFFSIDLGILFISSILLWITCKINVYNAYVELQKEFGFGYTIILALILNAWFIGTLIDAGADLTLEFDWIKGNISTLQNKT